MAASRQNRQDSQWRRSNIIAQRQMRGDFGQPKSNGVAIAGRLEGAMVRPLQR